MAIVGPIALYSNLPIHPEYYVPWRFVITGVTRGITTTVSMTIPAITTLNYVVGQLVRLIIPPTFGCRELNNVTAYVLSIPSSTSVVLDLDSSLASAYIASTARTPAQILAIGDINTGAINLGRQNNFDYIPGSFRDISPN